ncbi:MAG: PKD domain-containing protein [Haloarculaceae archaeon]
MRVAVAAAACLLVATVAPALAAGPLQADAGLDQRAVVGETVLLDGSGSRAPDGRFAAVEWTVETPDGTVRAPVCADCLRTRFVPHAPGVYEATLTVTAEGSTRSDYLRVVVGENGRPQVTVSGPAHVRPGATATYTATVTSENRLRSVVWTVDGRTIDRSRLDGHDANATASTVFTAARRDTVRATVYDVDGDAGVDSTVTSVGAVDGRGATGGGGGAGGGTGAGGGGGVASGGSGGGTGGGAGGGVDPVAQSTPTPRPGSPDISQPAHRGRYVDHPPLPDPRPAPTPEPTSGGGLPGPIDDLVRAVTGAVDRLVDVVSHAAHSLADALA